jgi:cell division septation protein DedD
LARVVFLLLFAMNLAAAGWWYSRAHAPEPQFSATDPNVPGLVLLHERDAAAMSTAATDADAAAQPVDPAAPVAQCGSLGPFETQSDLRRGLELLTPQVTRIQFQERAMESTRGYWVYLPAYSDRDTALKAARQLNQAGVRDYYVVTAGDHENTVSLGLFRDRENAMRRQGQISALGFPARLEERTEVERQFWIEFEQGAAAPDLSQLPGAELLSLKPRPCG